MFPFVRSAGSPVPADGPAASGRALRGGSCFQRRLGLLCVIRGRQERFRRCLSAFDGSLGGGGRLLSLTLLRSPLLDESLAFALRDCLPVLAYPTTLAEALTGAARAVATLGAHTSEYRFRTCVSSARSFMARGGVFLWQPEP